METRLEVLQLVLEQLGVDPSIDTVDDRVRFQKAIYLAQHAGVPLGYLYSWYVMGPYSPDLTRDYYALHESSEENDEAAGTKSLREPFVSNLKNIEPSMKPPEGVHLNQSQWLELMSSVHYLRMVEQRDEISTRQRLELTKPHLFAYTDRAFQRLSEVGLLAAPE